MCNIPALEPYVRKPIDAESASAEEALSDQLEKLILQPHGHVHRPAATMAFSTSAREMDTPNVSVLFVDCDWKSTMLVSPFFSRACYICRRRR